MKHLRKRLWKNDGFRSLFESSIHPDVVTALEDWKDNYNGDNYVLVGGLAYSYHVKPRATDDIDLIFLSFGDVPDNVPGFKYIRKHSFLHIKTHVEVEVLDPEFLNSTRKRFEKIFSEAIISDGVKIASARSLIVMKLKRFSNQDQADIQELIKYCVENTIDLNFDGYELTKEEKINFESLNETVYYQNMHMLECVSSYKNLIKIPTDFTEDFEIYISNEKYVDTPSFYFGRNIGSKIMKFDDFSFLIKIPDNINEELEVLSSSTDYKSFNSRMNEKTILEKWLSKNLDSLKKVWTKKGDN